VIELSRYEITLVFGYFAPALLSDGRGRYDLRLRYLRDLVAVVQEAYDVNDVRVLIQRR
jgi:hypothetical protein